MAKEHDESRGAAASGAPGASLSVDEVRSLIQMMDTSDVHELTIERESEGLRLILRKPTPVVGAAPFMGTAEAEAEGARVEASERASAEAAPVAAETSQKVTATLVGVFRVSLKRGSKAAVAEGDQVRLGQIVGAIEALNVMNEVETPVAGRVIEIVVKDGQPVEYGQHLMTIDTGAAPS